MKSTAAERRYLAREEAPAIQLARSEDSYVIDADGKRYLDFTRRQRPAHHDGRLDAAAPPRADISEEDSLRAMDLLERCL
jgi:hypothetical protein